MNTSSAVRETISEMTSASEGPPKTENDGKTSIVKYMTQSDRTNEPPPQPRVRKVTTVTNTLAVVVRKTEAGIGVWVLTSCEAKTIPATQPHLFVNLKLGTWMTVGIYPDGSIASFSPWSFCLQAYPTAVFNNNVFMTRKASEFQYEKRVSFEDIRREIGDPHPCIEINLSYINLYKVPGFGQILAHPSHDIFISQSLKSKADDKLWIEWCGDASRNYCWTLNSYIERTLEEELSEKQMREFAELIRNRKLNFPEVFSQSTDEVVARHFGLITDVNVENKTVSCWSPRVAMQADHIARIPQPPKHREVDSPMLPPHIGQWIQFDIQNVDMQKYMTSPTGNRLTIPEYLPISSPGGVAVAHVNKVVRMMISRILVKGTDHPNLFELPHYGFVIDRKANLISGTYAQLVLEKTSDRVRKTSGVCWIVEESMIVNPDDVTVENLKELSVEYVPTRDAMEVSHITEIENTSTLSSSKTSSAFANGSTVPTNGITTLKYQQPPQYYYGPRHDYYSGHNIQMGNGSNNNDRVGFHSKRKPSLMYSGATLDSHAIVEKIHSQPKTGILWLIETKISCHFTYTDDFPLSVGDYAHVKLIQKPDAATKSGFRWLWQSGTKRKAPFSLTVKSNTIIIQDTVEFQSFDKLNRTIFSSNLFPSIVDINNLVPNPQTNRKVSGSVTRRKIPNSMHDTPMFHWVLCSVSHFQAFIVPPYPYRSTSVRQLPSHSSGAIIENVRTPPPSDGSSASPPAQSVATSSSDE